MFLLFRDLYLALSLYTRLYLMARLVLPLLLFGVLLVLFASYLATPLQG